eukprot:gnl/Dysnectes_brevis/2061_a2382_815.p1 GENE.gnl/Dysnectes_brevis/2061_a2382_815~~gnl/Dysnectes_brevis/2061_a2382_815.p1  ORF type:complete len:492 (-),score=134.69 gnl/Dysnectes_brevis/2061_a2382_815:5-1408(-)
MPKAKGGKSKRNLLKPQEVVLLLRWVESLDVGDVQPTIDNLCDLFRNGLYLINILKRLNPQAKIMGIQTRGLNSPITCIKNLEIALQTIWQQSVKASQMPEARSIYHATSPTLLLSLLSQIFDAYVARQCRAQAKTVFGWIQRSLAPYSRALSLPASPTPRQLAAYVRTEMHEDFSSGTSFFCLLHARRDALFVEPPIPVCDSMHFTPRDEDQRQLNLETAFQLIIRAGVPLYWTAEEFRQADPSPRFLLFQLCLLHAELQGVTTRGPDQQECWADQLPPEPEEEEEVETVDPVIRRRPAPESLRIVEPEPEIQEPPVHQAPPHQHQQQRQQRQRHQPEPEPEPQPGPSDLREAVRSLSSGRDILLRIGERLLEVTMQLVGVDGNPPKFHPVARLVFTGHHGEQSALLLEVRSVSVQRHVVKVSARSRFSCGVPLLELVEGDTTSARELAVQLSLVLNMAYEAVLSQ